MFSCFSYILLLSSFQKYRSWVTLKQILEFLCRTLFFYPDKEALSEAP